MLSLFSAPTMGMMTYMIRKKFACWGEVCELPVFVFTTLEIAWEKYTVGFSLTERKIVYLSTIYDDVFKWKHFPRYWPFVREIHRSPEKSPHKGQRRGTLIFSLICSWINAGVNNREVIWDAIALIMTSLWWRFISVVWYTSDVMKIRECFNWPIEIYSY